MPRISSFTDRFTEEVTSHRTYASKNTQCGYCSCKKLQGTRPASPARLCPCIQPASVFFIFMHVYSCRSTCTWLHVSACACVYTRTIKKQRISSMYINRKRERQRERQRKSVRESSQFSGRMLRYAHRPPPTKDTHT